MNRQFSSPLSRKIKWAEWQRYERFPGLARWRPVKSEVSELMRGSVIYRRDRIKHLVRLHYTFRMRGQYVPPLIFRE